MISGTGKPKIGYVTSDLIEDLEDALGCNKLTPAVLVGAGKLGRALLDYNGFEEYGVQITAAFDCNEQIIRFNQTSKDILPIRQLKQFCKESFMLIKLLFIRLIAFPYSINISCVVFHKQICEK